MSVFTRIFISKIRAKNVFLQFFFCDLMKIIENAAFFRREIEFANKKQRFPAKFFKKAGKNGVNFRQISNGFNDFQKFSKIESTQQNSLAHFDTFEKFSRKRRVILTQFLQKFAEYAEKNVANSKDLITKF